MSNVENILKIHSIITTLTGIDNKYYVTNACTKLVRLSFEYIKKLDKTEVLIIPAYDVCLQVLSEFVNAKRSFSTVEEMVEQFEDRICQLEKINVGRYLSEDGKDNKENEFID